MSGCGEDIYSCWETVKTQIVANLIQYFKPMELMEPRTQMDGACFCAISKMYSIMMTFVWSLARL